MDSNTFNKIAAAVLIAGILALSLGILSEKLFGVHPMQKLKKGEQARAYPIEGADVIVTASAEPKAEPKAEPILALLANASVEEGKKVAKKCTACHVFEKGGPHKIGPKMWGKVNGDIAQYDDYAYSDALMNKEGVWTYTSLNKFLWKPKTYVPGTKMNFVGLRDPQDRADIIAYMRSMDDQLAALPTEAEIAAEQAELAPEEPDEEAEQADQPAEETPAPAE